jgi:hypothetical protein
MNTQRNEFKRMKGDVRSLLDGFIHAFSVAESVAELNDDIFGGTMVLAEASSLRRIIDEIQDDESGWSLITSCLSGVSSQCQIFGLVAMAYEANAIVARLEQLAGERDPLAA